MTWMHAMNGNASVEGIVKDLDALADAGVGGALLFSLGRKTPKGRVRFNSPEFHEVIQAGIKRAADRGLLFGLHNCDGWTSSGGPWITPELAMKRLVWSSRVVEGAIGGVSLPEPAKRNGFYRDVAVVAIPATADELRLERTNSRLTLSGSDRARRFLEDHDLDTAAGLPTPRKEGETAWLQREFDQPVTIASIRVEHSQRQGRTARVLASDDGVAYRLVAKIESEFRLRKDLWAYEASFEPHLARFFRVEFSTGLQVTEFILGAVPRVPGWLTQNGTSHSYDDKLQRLLDEDTATTWTPTTEVRELPAPDPVANTIDAALPAGRWRVLRFGYTTTGAYNNPATEEGRGLECDKLDAAAMDHHFDAYVGRVADDCGDLAGSVLRFAEIDSYEMGGQNWTAGLEDHFRRKRGYRLTPWLPLLAGFRIGSPSSADAVLGDFRQLLCERMERCYYRRFTELCNQRGMKSYVEPYGFGNLHELSVGGTCDIPMGEFWIDSREKYKQRSAVSAAHTYGKPVISAEAFTSWADLDWRVHPYLTKPSGDRAWALGINEFMFHRFTHQANPNVTPGMTMDNIGSHLDRTQPWWLTSGKAWTEYLHRGSWLLQQGTPVSDVLVYVGDAAQHPAPSQGALGIPAGYNSDLCDTRVLCERITVDPEDGDLVLPEGTRYKLLMLRNCKQLSLKSLQRVVELIRIGATVIGPPPTEPLGFLGRRDWSDEFTSLVQRVWGARGEMRRFGRGRVLNAGRWTDACGELVAPDLVLEGVEDAVFTHRRVGHSDVYLVRNDRGEPNRVGCSFRIQQGAPDLWDAATGGVTRLGVYRIREGRTELDLLLDPHGSAFVVFDGSRTSSTHAESLAGPDTEASLTIEDGSTVLRARRSGTYKIGREAGAELLVGIEAPDRTPTIEGPWNVRFDPATDEPAFVRELSVLEDWAEHADSQVRHFAGTATYKTVFRVAPESVQDGRRLELDLGRVEVGCAVTLNGQELATLWKPPFVIDATPAVVVGDNHLTLRVTNLWANRLIGDESLPKNDGYDHQGESMPAWYGRNEPVPGPRKTFTTFPFYRKTDALVPSGLIGPVRMRSTIEKRIGLDRPQG